MLRGSAGRWKAVSAERVAGVPKVQRQDGRTSPAGGFLQGWG